MRRNSIVLALCVAAGMSPVAVMAADTLARFDGGIGVIPNANGTPNVVRTVSPPGQPWVIRDLHADVKFGGAIKVNGKGLLLAGGNNIGFNAGASVFATLICGKAAPFTLHSTDSKKGVALAANGNFRIDDTLSPAPPDDCATPVLLIRNIALPAQGWFAAGIPDVPEQEPDISQMKWPFK